jgi:hypothetical protein
MRIITVSFLLIVTTRIKSSDIGYISDYKRPIPSNGPCIDIIEKIERLTTEKNVQCLGCYYVAQSECPTELNCQALINDMYTKCERINLPSRFYFDPPVSIRCLEARLLINQN